jgi:histidine triad (HIT) family protein
MSDCIFCQIIAGKAEASEIYRDERVMAFMDIRPVNVGHLLVIPLRHAVGLADLDPADGARLFEVGQRMAAALRRSGLPCEGVNLLLADGETAGQEVFHAHLHVIPRLQGDGFGFRFRAAYHSSRPSRADLELAAEMLRAA